MSRGQRKQRSSTSAKNDHTSLPGGCLQGLVIYEANVLHKINDKPWVLVGVEKQHVPQRPIRERRAKDGDVVAVRPVAHRALIVNFLPQPSHHLWQRPHAFNGCQMRTEVQTCSCLSVVKRAHLRGCPLGALRILLLLQSVQDGHDPVFKCAVVAVGHQQVAHTIQAPLAQIGAVQVEVPRVCGTQALHNKSSSCDHTQLAISRTPNG